MFMRGIDGVIIILIKINTNRINIHSFFNKNLFYKNVQAEINQHLKNILRTYPGWESIKNIFILLIFGK